MRYTLFLAAVLLLFSCQDKYYYQYPQDYAYEELAAAGGPEGSSDQPRPIGQEPPEEVPRVDTTAAPPSPYLGQEAPPDGPMQADSTVAAAADTTQSYIGEKPPDPAAAATILSAGKKPAEPADPSLNAYADWSLGLGIGAVVTLPLIFPVFPLAIAAAATGAKGLKSEKRKTASWGIGLAVAAMALPLLAAGLLILTFSLLWGGGVD